MLCLSEVLQRRIDNGADFPSRILVEQNAFVPFYVNGKHTGLFYVNAPALSWKNWCTCVFFRMVCGEMSPKSVLVGKPGHYDFALSLARSETEAGDLEAQN